MSVPVFHNERERVVWQMLRYRLIASVSATSRMASGIATAKSARQSVRDRIRRIRQIDANLFLRIAA